jgi:trehalose-6-phosphate synthase
VNEICGRINGLYGGLHHTPMLYLYQSVNFTQLCALYAVADAMIITSLRDGMNLVCYEYIVSQKDRGEKGKYKFSNRAISISLAPCRILSLLGLPLTSVIFSCLSGVLILSEFAGASHSLSGSVTINPHDTEGVVHAIHDALTMSIEEKADKFKELYDYVTYQTSARWGSTFISALQQDTPNLSASSSVLPSLSQLITAVSGGTCPGISGGTSALALSSSPSSTSSSSIAAPIIHPKPTKKLDVSTGK